MKRILSILLAFIIASSCAVYASALPTDDEASFDDIQWNDEMILSAGTPSLYDDDDFDPLSDEVRQEMLQKENELPDKVDLRDYDGKNYVTPVKFQNPFGSCWAFGIAAAAEISYLYDNNLGVPAGRVNDTVDFSEKYINWYMFHPITAEDIEPGSVRASQIGEGIDPSEAEEDDSNAVYEFGGNGSYASNFFASGFGPADESVKIDGWYPYYYSGKNRWQKNDETDTDEERTARIEYYAEQLFVQNFSHLVELGVVEDEDDYFAWFEANWDEGACLKNMTRDTSPAYASFDDWTLPLTKKYRNPEIAAYFKCSKTLPAPAGKDKDGEYRFNPLGVYAIKSEIASGHGVTISYLADQSHPGDEIGDQGYINTETWSQYYTGPVTTSHQVTIVGYDDNYKKENFTRTVNGETVEGSTPPSDGAFIVKNSWGAVTEEDIATATYNEDGNIVYHNPNANEWGIDNSGYFYLSYYDNSIMSAESFEFYSEDEVKYREMNYDQYDLLQTGGYDNIIFDEETKTANVFDAEEDEYLCQISFVTTVPSTLVRYEIYKEVADNDPTSGVLLEEGEYEADLGGYHRIDLSGEYFLQKGERYSVVITNLIDADNGADVYGAVESLIKSPRSEITINAVVNPGESWFYSDGEWEDWAVLKPELEEKAYQKDVEAVGGEEAFLSMVPLGRDYIQIDNFPIKAFLVSAALHDYGKMLGNVDCDEQVTILDATYIQRVLASLPVSSFNDAVADVDGDGGLTIVDATFIQRYLASLPAPFGIGLSPAGEMTDYEEPDDVVIHVDAADVYVMQGDIEGVSLTVYDQKNLTDFTSTDAGLMITRNDPENIENSKVAARIEVILPESYSGGIDIICSGGQVRRNDFAVG